MGSTGTTSKAALDVMFKNHPLVSLMENVPEVMKAEFVNFGYMKHQARINNFAFDGHLYNARLYGRRFDRMRAWILSLYLGRLRNPDTRLRPTIEQGECLLDKSWRMTTLLAIEDIVFSSSPSSLLSDLSCQTRVCPALCIRRSFCIYGCHLQQL